MDVGYRLSAPRAGGLCDQPLRAGVRQRRYQLAWPVGLRGEVVRSACQIFAQVSQQRRIIEWRLAGVTVAVQA